MPISFQQPAPSRAFSDIANSGNLPAYLHAYTALMGQAQERYARDRASAGHEMLGYAQLNQDAALRREALGLQANEQANAPMIQQAMIQNRARAEMDTWMAQQQFTARDQQELSRQQNVLGELMSKRDSGEISEEEFYQMAGRAAPRINALQAREAFTKNQALADQRKAHAQLFAEQAQQRDNALSFQRAEMDGKLGQYIAPKYKMPLAEMMQDAHPDIPQGTPEWDAMSTMLADEMGWTERYTKNAKGEMVFEKQVRGVGSSGAGGASQAMPTGRGGTELDAAHVNSTYESARKHVTTLAKEKKEDGTPAHPELQDSAKFDEKVLDEFKKQVSATSSHFAEQKSGPAKMQEAAMTSLQGAKDMFASAEKFSPQLKNYANNIVSEAQRLMSKYPPGKRPAKIAEKINALVDKIEQLKYNVEPNGPAQQVAPAAAPEQTQPGLLQRAGNVLPNLYNAIAGSIK